MSLKNHFDRAGLESYAHQNMHSITRKEVQVDQSSFTLFVVWYIANIR